MPRWQRIYLIICAAVIGYCLAYALADFTPLPRLTYFPRERAWRVLEYMPSALPMNYYGLILWGLGGAAVAGALVAVACARARGELAAKWLRLAGAWALTAVALGSGYFLWNIWPF